MIDGVDEALGDDCPDQALLLPLGEGPAAGALLVGTNPLSPLDDQYVGFCQLLADQLSSAMAAAVSYEQQRSGPTRSPNWTAQKQPSSPTSATNSAPR